MTKLITLILCHLVGDYVLQSDYIANTKGENWYHLFVHSALYCVPFILVFGFSSNIFVLFLMHMFIDAMKAKYKQIGYVTDQIIHYWVLVLLLVSGGIGT